MQSKLKLKIIGHEIAYGGNRWWHRIEIIYYILLYTSHQIINQMNNNLCVPLSYSGINTYQSINQ